jgi:hypothetical protein
VQSLAGAISATSNPGPALGQVQVITDLEDVVADILRRTAAGQSKTN